jgi:hypothetical protein
MTLTIDLTEHEARTLIYACELTRDIWDTGHVHVAALDRASDAPAEKPLEIAHAKLVNAFEDVDAPAGVGGSAYR